MNRVRFRRNIKYAALYSLYYCIGSIAITFASVYLPDRGYSISETGMILSGGYLAGIFLQPFIAGFADRSKRIPVPVFLMIDTALLAVCLGCMLCLRVKCFGMTVCYICGIGTMQALVPLINTCCFYLDRMGEPILYGVARGIGVLIWSGNVALMGLLSNRVGSDILPKMELLFTGFLLLLLLTILHEGKTPVCENIIQEQKPKEKLDFRTLMRRYAPFLLLLIGTVILSFSWSTVDLFPNQIVANMGGTTAQMGAFCSFIGIMEMPTLFLFDPLRRRFGCRTLVTVGALFFIVKLGAYYLASSLAGLYLAAAFQMCSFSIFSPAEVYFANEMVDHADTTKAQALVSAMISAGCMFGSSVGGFILDMMGVKWMLLVSVMMAAVASGFVIASVRRSTIRA